jgi:hypothetical protein
MASAAVFAVESVTLTSNSAVGSHLVKYTFAWVADGSGNVADNPVSNVVKGYIVQVAFVPDSGGTQPLDLYDVTLDGYGGSADMIGGNGANLSNTTASTVAISAPVYFDGTEVLDLNVSGAGADNGGTMHIWIAGSQAPR